MKKVFSLSSIAVVAILFIFMFACNKQEDLLPDTGGQDVSFEILNNSLLNKTKNGGGDIECQDHLASYVKVVIDGQVQKIAAFYVADRLYSNTVSMQPGSHIISDFLVYWDGGTTSTENDDVLISATPHTGSTFGSYVQNPLNVEFNVKADKKTAVLIEVLCYTPQNQASFGFVYFGAEEVIVRTMNFFGDLCIKSRSAYAGSEYEHQTEWANALGEFIDVPAIAKIEVWRSQDGGASTLQNTFSNSIQGETVKVTYGDYKSKNDKYEFKLFIYQKIGSAFVYHYVKSFIFQDAEELLSKTDSHGKTTYYVQGTCTPGANYIFDEYVDVPVVVCAYSQGYYFAAPKVWPAPGTVTVGGKTYTEAEGKAIWLASPNNSVSKKAFTQAAAIKLSNVTGVPSVAAQVAIIDAWLGSLPKLSPSYLPNQSSVDAALYGKASDASGWIGDWIEDNHCED